MNKRAEIAKMAKSHSSNACNRVIFHTKTRFDDPYKLLAAAVILQAAIDKVEGENERFYWYYGRKVSLTNEITEEDYWFYADMAGINCSWAELVRMIKRHRQRFSARTLKDAAELLCI